MAYVIAQNCCNEASCIPVCPVNCIHPTPDEPDFATAEMLYIDPDSCIDCGACFDACPVSAIHPDYELPAEQSIFGEWNARYFDGGAVTYSAVSSSPPRRSADAADGPLAVAIVGSGPSGFYAATELLGVRSLDVSVDMFERLPVPGGLVRFGVAPDHQDTKGVFKSFASTLAHKNFRFFGNIEIGRDISHKELAARYHAVIYAVGASSDRRLNIPGEDLAGSHSATEFVAWYNGHPEHRDADFDLGVERAVIIGNGNVAMDVARILLSDVDRLRTTDIADHALERLTTSKVREVVLVGRRGPSEAAFSGPELFGLGRLEDASVRIASPEHYPSAIQSGAGSGRMTEAKLRLLDDLHARPEEHDKVVRMSFLRSPLEILGTDCVTGIRLSHNALVTDDNGSVRAVASDEVEEIECGLVFRAVGYRGVPMDSVPFDDERGVLPNVGGRIVESAGGPVRTGLYTVGWVKRGPSGVIGSNKVCADETVEALLADFAAGRLTRTSEVDVADELSGVVDKAGWRAIDTHERNLGKESSRPRVKLTSVEEMLAAGGL